MNEYFAHPVTFDHLWQFLIWCLVYAAVNQWVGSWGKRKPENSREPKS